MRKPRAEVETEEYFEESPPEALTGSAPSDTDSELAGLLAEMACGALKLGLLLSECNESEWRANLHRLGLFASLVKQLPTKPRPGRRMGFAVQVRAAKVRRR